MPNSLGVCPTCYLHRVEVLVHGVEDVHFDLFDGLSLGVTPGQFDDLSPETALVWLAGWITTVYGELISADL